MEIAIELYQCLTNGSDVHKILDLFNQVKDKDSLALINEFFMEQYNKTTHEFIAEKYSLDEVYAISSTLKFIRDPSDKTIKNRNKFYAKIGYIQLTERE